MKNPLTHLTLSQIALQYISNDGNSHPVPIVQSFDLQVKRGEFVAILGPSACGKTSLLNMVAGFIPPTSGYIKLNDEMITKPSPACGMIFQDPSLFPWLTVKENIGFGLKVNHFNKDQVHLKEQCQYWLKIMQLQPHQDKYPHQLSGGLKQRVALARCLVLDPEIILLDEPLAALDALTREYMQSLIYDLNQQTHKTMIMVTHQVEEALLLADRIIILTPAPSHILKQYDLKFKQSDQIQNSSSSQQYLRLLRKMPEFNQLREEILDIIFAMEHSNFTHIYW